MVCVVLPLAAWLIAAPLLARARGRGDDAAEAPSAPSSRRRATPSTPRSATPSSTTGRASCRRPTGASWTGGCAREAVEVLHRLDELGRDEAVA